MTLAPTLVGLVGGHSSARVRYAFTLIEILVVITLFMILMGLTLGSVVRGPNLQRMVAAEQVIADCIRQARHTARTSGQPVVLFLDRDRRQVSGLLRTTLWQRSDWPAPASGADVPGRTGSGLWLREGVEDAGGNLDLSLLSAAGGELVERRQMLARGVAGVTAPALMLSLWVRPPIAGPGVDMVPLIHIGEKTSPATDPAFADLDRSIMGLLLLRADDKGTAGSVGSAVQKVNTSGKAPVTPSWEILGWLDDGTVRHEVSSVVDAPKDQVRSEAQVALLKDATGADVVASVGEDVAAPLIGGRWTEITLLFDQGSLTVYRDGRRVGQKKTDASSLKSTVGGEQVYVGCLRTGGTGPGLTVCTKTTIDDIRLERLGTEVVGNLPGGVSFKDPYRVTCHPDGRVEVNADGSVAAPVSTPIELTSTSAEQAIITVLLDGSVSSRIP